jgi:mRNA interferase RelE/StbE
MEKYKLSFKKSIQKDFRPIPKEDVARILESINALAEDPRRHGTEKLSGQSRYRLRQGVYRILYEILEDTHTVLVVKIAHRRQVYRRGR